MKLGTLNDGTRDGKLVVISRDNSKYVLVSNIATTLQQALDDWAKKSLLLHKVYEDLNANKVPQAEVVSSDKFHSPLPRAYQWADGSAFIHHIRLVRQARNAEMPETLETVPLMYQGGSDNFLTPTEDIPQVDFSHGTDFEGEVGVITTDVPLGVSPDAALDHIALFVMINDVSLRGLIPEELKGGFGFFQSKPSSSFGPFAVTKDELGEAWKNGRICLPLNIEYNGKFFGKANAQEMFFHFGQLIAHAAKTRALAAGTIIGSGTVSNEDNANGYSCIQEIRMIEKIKTGEFKTPFMKNGDTVKMEMKNLKGENIFGTIFQKVKAL
jgi:fumarylacetoacetate (FAA) hydrolase